MRLLPSRPLLMLACVLIVAGCGDRGGRGLEKTPGGKAVVHEPEGRLDILAWSGFAIGTDGKPDETWMRPFEKATACEVHVRRAEHPDQLLALSEREGLDLVLATSDISGPLIQAGRVQAIDTHRVPALAGVTALFANGPWASVGGVTYGVPFQWAPMRLQFDPSAIGLTRGVELRDVFEQQAFGDGKTNVGRVRAFNRPIQIADAAVYLHTARPELGITDPYALNETQYTASLQALRAQRRLAASNDSDAVVAGVWMDAEPLSLPQPVPGTRLQRPSGGATGVVVVSMLHAGAQHPNCAMAWMQWSIKPAVQARVSGTFLTLPVTAAACSVADGLGQAWCDSMAVSRVDDLSFWRTPSARCGKNSCVPYSRWVADFEALRRESPSP